MARLYDSEPSISDLLIATLLSGRSKHAFYSILSERQFKKYKKESVSVALNRLRRRKYLNYREAGWSLTVAGRSFAKRKRLLEYIPSPFEKSSPDMTIVAFDIPEPDRVVRNWLRNQLKIFGYKMLQQSLWIGPGPLPVSFLGRLEKLKIRKKVKIFSKVTKTN